MSKKYFDENGKEVKITEEQGPASAGEGVKGCGSAMSGCGCLMVILVTIPILLLLFF